MKNARIIYLLAALLFLAGVTAQVFLAGMVVVAGEMGWSSHGDLGHALALPLLLMLATVYFGRLPRGMKIMTLLLFVIYILQADVIIFLRGSAPIVSAFHPVLALADFALALTLSLKAWQVVRQGDESTSVTGEIAATASD